MNDSTPCVSRLWLSMGHLNLALARQAVKAHRIHLLAAAEEDLGKVKRQFFLQLAKDRGVLAEYLREVKVPMAQFVMA